MEESAGPQPVLHVEKPKKTKKLNTVLLVILLIAALGAAGYAYWVLRERDNDLSRARADIESLEARLAAHSDEGEAAAGAEEHPDSGLPVVVFSPGGLFTDSEKTEITAKMINPLKHWSRDQGDELVSIHVQQAEGASEYRVDVIHLDGVYEGLLYGTVDAASQNWWTPTCLDACEFSDEFTEAYPEVVAATES